MINGQRPGATPPPTIFTGPRRRLDRYELIAEIASGGMAKVLLARLAGTGGFSRLFAIKLLHPHLASDSSFVDMLLDEARLAARLHHSNAVPIIDVCESALGLYLVMDYVEGLSFSRILGTRLLTPEERLRIGVQALLGVLAGLDAAHNMTDDSGAPLGLVHRDVSPQNVLIGIDGVGRIADFGIAHAGTRITHTQPGTLKGKIAYMAPEQATGGVLDRRADVFSVGVMLWECLTGRRLFKAENEAATLLQVLHEPIPSPSTLRVAAPVELDAVCIRALARFADARYATAHDMAAELARAAERSGYLASSLEAADLMQSHLGQELNERRESIQRYCSALNGNSGAMRLDELAQLPKLSPSRRTPVTGTVTHLHEVSPVTISFDAAAEDESEAEPSATNAEIPSLRPPRRASRIAIGLLLVIGLAAIGLWRIFSRAPEETANSAAAPRPSAEARAGELRSVEAPAVEARAVTAPAAAETPADSATVDKSAADARAVNAVDARASAARASTPAARSTRAPAALLHAANKGTSWAPAPLRTPSTKAELEGALRAGGAPSASDRHAGPSAAPKHDGAAVDPSSEPALELNPYRHR